MEPYASRIKDANERRAKAGRYAPGVAAYSDSDMFKKPPVTTPPMRNIQKKIYSRVLTALFVDSRHASGQKMGQ